MKQYLYIFLLVIITPITAELMNGSTSLIKFLGHPLSVIVFIFLPYSCLAIILSSMKSKSSRTGFLFLLPIAGLVIEGLLVNSFFDVGNEQLSNLAGIGVWGHVQWPWTLSLLASHGVTSCIVPLFLADFLSKGNKNIPKWAFYLATTLLGLVFIFGILVRPNTISQFGVSIMITFLIIGLLFGVAQKSYIPESRNSVWSTKSFFVAGFLFAPINWLTSFGGVKFLGAYTIILQFIFISAFLYFIWSQWLNPKTDNRARVYSVIGYFIPHAVILTLLGFSNPYILITGILSLVGIGFLCLHYQKK